MAALSAMAQRLQFLQVQAAPSGNKSMANLDNGQAGRRI
jgi:hypothetical protein